MSGSHVAMLRHQYESPSYQQGSQDQTDLTRRTPSTDSVPKPVIGRRKEAMLSAQGKHPGSSFIRTRTISSVPDLDLYPSRDVPPSASAPITPARQTYLWDDFLRDTPRSTRWTDMSQTPYDYPTMDSTTVDSPWSINSPNRSAPAILDSSPSYLSERRTQNRSLPLLDTLQRNNYGNSSTRIDVLPDYDETGPTNINYRDRYDQSNMSQRNILNPRSTDITPSGQTTAYSTLRGRPTSPVNQSHGSTVSPKSLEETNSSANSKTPIHKQNGLLPTHSQRNLNISKPSLNVSKVDLYANNYGIPKSIASLALMGTTSLITAMFGLLLLFQLTSRNKVYILNSSTLDNSSHNSALEVAVALTSFVIMLDLCCMTVCAVQCFFTAKLLKVPQGEERAFQYLRDCASTRFISISGFFLSVPFLLIAVLLYMLMEYHTTPAVIASVIMAAGVLFVVAALVHSTIRWRIHKTRANHLESPSKTRSNQLSTLV